MLKGCGEDHSLSSYKNGYCGSEPLKDSLIQDTCLGFCGASRQLQRCHVCRSPLSHTCPAPYFTEEAAGPQLPGDCMDSIRQVGLKSWPHHLLAV